MAPKVDEESPEFRERHVAAPISDKSSTTETDRQHSVGEKELPDSAQRNTNAKLRNPLTGLTKEQLRDRVETFAAAKGLTHIVEDLKKGALIAQDPKNFENLEELSEEDKTGLRREVTHRWHQPFMLYFLTSEYQTGDAQGHPSYTFPQFSVLDQL